ncbi:UDP-glucuronosyltransferase 2B15 [Orchesella cincta]|uniref:UDP-glucuronosyltransferase 2B15 n=1 Tax=Orchesella cincta TaxID=48709 RepID=A0A1D2NEJ3_ORCCI|nr:UDP-glucuronosyltransferase 2B15 [Orchesella cincta]
MPFYWSYYKNAKFSPMLQEAARPLFGDDEVLPSLYELENNMAWLVGLQRRLPKIKNFMDKSGSEGVVLISFGSTVLLNTVSTHQQAMFFHMIHEFPDVRFIMRWSGPLPKFLDEAPSNLLVSEWLPQKEILNHPKLKLFVTHGGVSSIQEATYYGIPMIVIPLFADQDYNAYRIEAQEVGLRAEIRGMTADTLVTAVDKILKDDKYKKNMVKKSAIFRDRPQNPVDTAVFWTEFALRHEETMSTFRPMNQHLNAFQRRLLDVYVFFAGLLILVFVVFLIILKNVIPLIRNSSHKEKYDREKLKKEE